MIDPITKVRQETKTITPCDSCGLPLIDEFVDDEHGGLIFDGVVGDDGTVYHHGCEPF